MPENKEITGQRMFSKVIILLFKQKKKRQTKKLDTTLKGGERVTCFKFGIGFMIR